MAAPEQHTTPSRRPEPTSPASSVKKVLRSSHKFLFGRSPQINIDSPAREDASEMGVFLEEAEANQIHYVYGDIRRSAFAGDRKTYDKAVLACKKGDWRQKNRLKAASADLLLATRVPLAIVNVAAWWNGSE